MDKVNYFFIILSTVNSLLQVLFCKSTDLNLYTLCSCNISDILNSLYFYLTFYILNIKIEIISKILMFSKILG